MRAIWTKYLDNYFPTEDFEEILVYTDSSRFWLTEGLLDTADQRNWKASVLVLEEINDDEILEIKQSFAVQSTSTFLVSAFSEKNPIINELNAIFSPFSPPVGYQGYSLIIQPNFPDQFFPNFLNQNYNLLKDNEEYLKQNLKVGTIQIRGDGNTHFEFEIVTDPIAFPYEAISKRNHVIFPATELLLECKNSSINGVITLNRSIGEIIVNDELVDPMGRIEEPFDVLIEEGLIIDIIKQDHLSRRFSEQVDALDDKEKILDSVTFGLSTFQEPVGNISVDRLSFSCLTMGNSSKSIEFCVSGFKIVN